jgi:hypothetical protein
MWCLPLLMEPSGVAAREWEMWFALALALALVLADMIDWGGGRFGSSWMLVLVLVLLWRLTRAATERLLPSFGRTAKEKEERERVAGRVGVSSAVGWGSGE